MYSSEFKTIILIILIISLLFYLKISTVEKMTDDTSLSQVQLTAIRNLGNIAADMVNSSTNTLTLPYNVVIDGTLTSNGKIRAPSAKFGWCWNHSDDNDGDCGIEIKDDVIRNKYGYIKINGDEIKLRHNHTNDSGETFNKITIDGNMEVSRDLNLSSEIFSSTIYSNLIELATNQYNNLEFKIKAVDGPRAGQYINYSSVSVNNYKPDNSSASWKISIGSGRTAYRWLPKTTDNPGTIFKFVPRYDWHVTKKGKLYAKDLPLRTGWSSAFIDGDNSELVSSTNDTHVYDSRMFINSFYVNRVIITGHTNNEILGIENSDQPSVVGLSTEPNNQYTLELEFV